MKRRALAIALAAGLLTLAAATTAGAGGAAKGIITEVILEVGKPAAAAPDAEQALLPPVTLVVYDSLGLSGIRRLMQIEQMLRDSYRLEALDGRGPVMLELAIGQSKPAPPPVAGLDVSFTLLDVDDVKATYELRLAEAGKDPVTTKVAVKRSDWGIVGGRDGAQAPYFFVMFRPLSLEDEQEERRWKGMTRPKLVKSGQPAYPEAARKAKLQDVVVLELGIDAGGNVTGAAEVAGTVPELIAAAKEAVMQWKFDPARDAAGKPFAATYTITVAFKLQ